MSVDPGDLIADAIVDYVNDAARAYSMQFAADNPDDPAEALNLDETGEQHRGIQVLFLALTQERKRLDGSGVEVRPVINGFVSRYLGDGVTRRDMSSLAREIFTSLENVEQSGYHWQETEIVTHWDSEKLTTQDRFLSVFALTYFGTE